MATRLISDTHFGHSNIIKYCNRPFLSVNDMNEEMIFYWNGVVRPNDTVIHVGDFSFMRDDEARAILQRLNGRKILVRGNHDKSAQRMSEIGFDLVVESLMMHLPKLGKCFLTHHPIESDSALKSILDETSCNYQIHGHSHNGRPLFDGLRYNVSVENIDYRPILPEDLPIEL